MGTVGELLENGADLSEADRQLLLRLYWLRQQVDEATQLEVAQRIRAFSRQPASKWRLFINEVRTLIAELESVRDRRREEPE